MLTRACQNNLSFICMSQDELREDIRNFWRLLDSGEISPQKTLSVSYICRYRWSQNEKPFKQNCAWEWRPKGREPCWIHETFIRDLH